MANYKDIKDELIKIKAAISDENGNVINNIDDIDIEAVLKETEISNTGIKNNIESIIKEFIKNPKVGINGLAKKYGVEPMLVIGPEKVETEYLISEDKVATMDGKGEVEKTDIKKVDDESETEEINEEKDSEVISEDEEETESDIDMVFSDLVDEITESIIGGLDVKNEDPEVVKSVEAVSEIMGKAIKDSFDKLMPFAEKINDPELKEVLQMLNSVNSKTIVNSDKFHELREKRDSAYLDAMYNRRDDKTSDELFDEWWKIDRELLKKYPDRYVSSEASIRGGLKEKQAV